MNFQRLLLISVWFLVGGTMFASDINATNTDSAKSVQEILVTKSKKGDAIMDIYVNPPWLYTVSQTGGFKIYNLSASEPVKVIPLTGQPVQLFYDGKGIVYIRFAPGNGIHTIDVKKPTDAAYLRLAPVRYMRDMVFMANGAYVAAEDDGLKRVQFQGDSISADNLKGCDFATELASKGDYLYVACGTIFEVMNVLRSSTPVIVGHIQFDSDIMNLVVDGDIVYAPIPTGHVNIINVKNPAKPIVLKKVYAEAEYRGTVAFDEKYAYIGSRRGITIINKQTYVAKELDFGTRVYKIQIIGRDAYCLGGTRVFKVALDKIDFEQLPVVPEYISEGDGGM